MDVFQDPNTLTDLHIQFLTDSYLQELFFKYWQVCDKGM